MRPLRRAAAAARKALIGAEREHAGASLTCHLRKLMQVQGAMRVGSYRAYGSEADPADATRAMSDSIELYLPIVVGAERALRFAVVDAHTRYRRSALGIDEPIADATVSAATLQLILVPLLAFDRAGTRVGHGGGYYDRSLAECERDTPVRVGVAFAVQEQVELPRREWDQPLHWVVTDKEIIQCQSI